MKKSPDLENQVRAINQLLSVIVGARFARDTASFKTFPTKRVEACHELTLAEYKKATESLGADPDRGNKAVAQVHRKLDSLRSLLILAECVEENLWDLEE